MDMEVDHKKLAATYFNGTWDLIDKKEWTADEKFQMIEMAHASRFHWSFVGTEKNFARGDWQISRVYALLGLGESAMLHAERCLHLTKIAMPGPLDMAFAHEAIARAALLLGDTTRAAEMKALAVASAETIDEEGERKYVLSEIDTIVI